MYINALYTGITVFVTNWINLHFASSSLQTSRLNLSPIVKCGHLLSGKVRKVGPLNQTWFLTKSFKSYNLETITAGLKFEHTKCQ